MDFFAEKRFLMQEQSTGFTYHFQRYPILASLDITCRGWYRLHRTRVFKHTRYMR